VTIPESHRDLLEGRFPAALATVMPNGDLQTTVVWVDADAQHIRINTMKNFQKEKNMRRDPHVTLFIYDPANTLRFLEIRGAVVEMTEDGALEHLDGLSIKYTGNAPYFGTCVPAELAETETPVLVRIAPTKVVATDFRKE